MPNAVRRLAAPVAVAVAVAACARPSAPAFAPAAGWTPQPSGVTTSLRGVSAVSERVAWASGARNTVLRTVDGGATWEQHPVPGADSLDFRSVGALDARTAFVASAGDGASGQARIYRTTDGGATWTLALADTAKGAFFDALALWDTPPGSAPRGLAVSDPVGGRMHIVATDDGGRTWRQPAQMPSALAGEGAYAAGNAALTVGPDGSAWFVTGGPNGARVFRSRDAGRTWDVVDAPLGVRGTSAGLFAVAFRDARTGVAVGGDYTKPHDPAEHILRSADGGATWTRPAHAVPGFWSGLAYVRRGAGDVIAVGGAGTAVSRDDGATWVRVDTTELNAVSFAGATAGWAVGPRGRVVRWGRR
jgi:photosystem II stability/assembly factor-like uncharacterized protein